MKFLNKQNLNAISGGQAQSITITKKISTVGISEKCIQLITDPKIWLELSSLPQPDIIAARINEYCSVSEFNLLGERLNTNPLFTVTYE